ncbi:hypothetical protein Tsubulata_017161 [Turnera subulata]|uniref:J domain-containing protein n=1 Tax=Turnera subulata TaxID=218843 RepID=A0A9Q0FFT7_9ROSI|nr:hypothetical protein Tsubulata_017161 [Turnera subulata]
MDIDVDHYNVLGLPSGEEGAKLTEKEIQKAYRAKALELHPDKRPDDPNASTNFQKLKSSYEILKDANARKLFDELLRVKREKQVRRTHLDAKRRKMTSDLEERERAAFAPDPAAEEREEEERVARRLREEIARIRAMNAKKGAPATATAAAAAAASPGSEKKESTSGMDKERMLKVSWEKVGEDYSAEKLRELFSRFGEVEDVVIKSSKKKGSAIVVMATKDAAVAATGTVSGYLSNPLLVLPVQRAAAMEFPTARKTAEADRLNSLAGAGFNDYENSILEKLKKFSSASKEIVHCYYID